MFQILIDFCIVRFGLTLGVSALQILFYITLHSHSVTPSILLFLSVSGMTAASTGVAVVNRGKITVRAHRLAVGVSEM